MGEDQRQRDEKRADRGIQQDQSTQQGIGQTMGQFQGRDQMRQGQNVDMSQKLRADGTDPAEASFSELRAKVASGLDSFRSLITFLDQRRNLESKYEDDVRNLAWYFFLDFHQKIRLLHLGQI